MLHQNNLIDSKDTVQTKEKKTKKKHRLFCRKHKHAEEISSPIITLPPHSLPPNDLAEKPQDNTRALLDEAQEQIQTLNQSLLNLQKENLTLEAQHKTDTVMQGYLMILKGTMPRGEVKELLEQIIEFENDSPQGPHKSEFLQRLKKFADDLNTDFIKQSADNNISIEKTPAYTLTYLTTQMLKDLRDNSKKDKILVLKNYEKACNTTPGWKKFFKGLAMVCFAAVGFVMGAAIGMTVGMLAGAWSGPGAFVIAALGCFSGAVSGTALGVTAGALATGVGSAALGGLLLFTPTKLERKGIALGKNAEHMFKRQP